MKIALRAFNGKIVTAWDLFQGYRPLHATDRDAIGEGETFELIVLDGPTPPVPPIPPVHPVDMIPLASANYVGGGAPKAWPITTAITGVTFYPDGLLIEFAAKTSWPDVIPPGWAEAVVYSIVLGTPVNGVWQLAAVYNCYARDAKHELGPVLEPHQYPANLWYLNPVLAQVVPRVADPIAVMVCAGGLRGLSAVKVEERSQVVTCPLPATQTRYPF